MYIIGTFGFTLSDPPRAVCCVYCPARWHTEYKTIVFRVHRDLCYIDAWHKLVAHS